MTVRRQTRQQAAVRNAVEKAGRPLSVEEIHEKALTEVPSLGVSTVYRALRRLEEDGVIVGVNVPGQPDRYETADAAATHHHHFHCEACDRVFDIAGCVGGLEKLLPDGFVLEGHELTLSGRCSRCTSKDRPEDDR